MNDMSNPMGVSEAELLLPDVPVAPGEELTGEEFTREKILTLFRVYPVMNPTMLQAALGPSLSPRIWRPVFEELLREGVLASYELPADEATVGRSRPFQCVKLVPTPT